MGLPLFLFSDHFGDINRMVHIANPCAFCVHFSFETALMPYHGSMAIITQDNLNPLENTAKIEKSLKTKTSRL